MTLLGRNEIDKGLASLVGATTKGPVACACDDNGADVGVGSRVNEGFHQRRHELGRKSVRSMRSIERKQANVSAASNDQVIRAFVCRSLLRFPGCVQDFRPPIGVSVPATPCIPSGRTRPSEHGLPRPAFFGKELRAVKTPRHDRVAAPRFHLIGESFGGTVPLYTSVVQGARLLSA